MKAPNFIPALVAIAILGSFASCSNYISEIPEQSSQEVKKVSVATRSTSDIIYPLTLYAFYAKSGFLAKCVTIQDESEALEFPLAVGSYHLVALAGSNDLDIGASPSVDESIGVPDDGIMNTAVQMGHADISVVDENVQVNMVMSLQVAEVNIELQDIPSDVTEVSVSFSSLYTGETFRGSLNGTAPVVLQLTKHTDGTTWSHERFYTLPGNSTQLTLSISMTSESGVETYGYTHISNLKSATPYQFVGSFIEGFNLTGIITCEGWNELESIAFTFGLGADNLEDPADGEAGNEDTGESGDDTLEDDVNTDGTYSVTEIPSVKSIWNGHFVAAVQSGTNGDEAELLLLSLNEWSATGDEASSVASDAVADYTEDGLGDWRVPTSAELLGIIPSLSMSGNIDGTNAALINAGGTKLSNGKSYLCDDAAKFLNMGSTSAAVNIATSGDYLLRLVKSVSVKVE